jgi:murein DD-endopeptidase MepM/ murein hydrolase activator NlpD
MIRMNRLFDAIRARWHDFFRKRRFSMLHATDRSEEWHVHLSPAGIVAGLVAFVLLLFILILTLTAYTPVLEFLPGYRTEADRSRENIMQQILRLDSMERVIDDMATYNRNIALILEGKTPAIPSSGTLLDTLRGDKTLVPPSAEDSLLRAQMEGSGAYGLGEREAATRRQVREAIELAKPAEGIITDRFDIPQGCYGVRIAAPAEARITAVDTGTVVQSLWAPENGYTVILQHANNLISVYKGLSQSLVSTGQTVRGGDQLGYNAAAVEGETRLFEFELWSNGKPVDPESYIVF